MHTSLKLEQARYLRSAIHKTTDIVYHKTYEQSQWIGIGCTNSIHNQESIIKQNYNEPQWWQTGSKNCMLVGGQGRIKYGIIWSPLQGPRGEAIGEVYSVHGVEESQALNVCWSGLMQNHQGIPDQLCTTNRHIQTWSLASISYHSLVPRRWCVHAIVLFTPSTSDWVKLSCNKNNNWCGHHRL